MRKSNTRQLTVASSTRLTPNMQRVVLTGDELEGFPEGQESGYIKLLFPEHPNSTNAKPVMRTYTIRAFDTESKQLTIDFALHGEHGGPASSWAHRAKAGDTLLISGPGPTKLISNHGDWALLVGDMTALPAIACNLERLPEDTVGHAIIEIIEDADRQALAHPAGVEIHWVVNPLAHSQAGGLANTVRALPWAPGKADVWCACEFHSMRDLRSYLKKERNVEKQNLYISSYWKIGRSEEQHKLDKREDLNNTGNG